MIAVDTTDTTNTGSPSNSHGPAVLSVSALIEETDDARSIVFNVPEGQEHRFTYRPGQFLTLRIPSDRTGSVARCYSLSSSPFVDGKLKVTVKRTSDGYGSNWLCDRVEVGDAITVLPPAGAFTPKSLDGDFLLLGAGSGITPIMSILKSVLAKGQGNVVLVYANRDEGSVIFADEIRALGAEHPDRVTIVHWLESLQGLPTPEALSTLIAPFLSHEAFICGPRPFMVGVQKSLRDAGVARTRVHVEVFTSLAGDPFVDHVPEIVEEAAQSSPATAMVTLDSETFAVTWPRSQTLVETLLAMGKDVPYSCQEGECGSCACTVLKGEVEMANCEILDPADIADGYILGCQSRPVSDELEIEF